MLNRRSADQEMEREIASHLALLAEGFERRGMDPENARFAARRALGGADQAREAHRDARSLVWLEQIWQDLNHALRTLARNPGFALVSVLTLALGIGVNTTLFSAYNALALKPLPVADPREVVRVKRWFQSGARGDVQFAFSYPEYLYARDHSTQFASIVAASWPFPVPSAASERLQGQLVSLNYFTALGIPMRLGRGFVESEDGAAAATPVVVLSYAFWQRHFQGDPSIPGKTVLVSGSQFQIAGVAAEDFTGTSIVPLTPDFFAPLTQQRLVLPSSDWLHSQEDARFQLLARLKPLGKVAAAQSEIDGLIRQFDQPLTLPEPTTSVTLQQTTFLAEADDARFQALVAGLGLVVGLVLMVACANIANMLLARGAARRREIAARLMLGASRSRVVRHLLTESLVLALLGGAGGLVLSLWTSRLLWLEISSTLTGLGGGALIALDLSPDLRVISYALLLSVLAGVFFGLSPALQSTRMDLVTVMKEENAMFGGRSRFRGFLIGAQATASMILLICASFLARGLIRAQTAETGFDTKHLLLVNADSGADAAVAFARQQQMAERIRAVPQVESVALGGAPMTGTWTPPIQVGDVRQRTLASYATAGYFETLGIPILRGRGFDEADSARAPDRPDSSRHAVVSESAVRMFWPAEDPVGKRFKLDLDFRGKFVDFEVIGVVRDVRYANLSRIDPAHVYLSGFARSSAVIAVRANGDALTAAANVRRALAGSSGFGDLQPSVVVFERGPLAVQRSMSRAFGMFAMVLAALAIGLAGIGIYGVTSYLVGRQTREIGIRAALGASGREVLQATVLGGLRPVSIGLVLGALGAVGASYSVKATLEFPGSIDFFYGLAFYDPITFLGAAAFFLTVAAIASAVPARQALRVDPMTALRYE